MCIMFILDFSQFFNIQIKYTFGITNLNRYCASEPTTTYVRLQSDAVHFQHDGLTYHLSY